VVAERVRKLAITLPGQRHHLLGVVVWIEAIEELRGEEQLDRHLCSSARKLCGYDASLSG
jgi:hypothetical protein